MSETNGGVQEVPVVAFGDARIQVAPARSAVDGRPVVALMLHHSNGMNGVMIDATMASQLVKMLSDAAEKVSGMLTIAPSLPPLPMPGPNNLRKLRP